MYTSYIGKNFLNLYRRKMGIEMMTAEDFFVRDFQPLFFNDDRHLMHVHTSPFFQKPSIENINKHGSITMAQKSRLEEKIAAGIPSGDIYVGFGAEDVLATSSGQMTELKRVYPPEEMYASWIGQALSIGMKGGINILVDDEQVIWNIYQGWKHYSEYHSQTPGIKDKQIETWNGQWLFLSQRADFNPNMPFANLTFEPETVLSSLAIPTIEWVRIIFCLSRICTSTPLLYAYNLSQTNTTIGFIPLFINDVTRLYEIKVQLFNFPENIGMHKLEEVYSTHFGFKEACKQGSIGLKALEPDKLRTYMPKGSVPYAAGKPFKLSNDDSVIQYQLYKTWIMAMLNNKNQANELAGRLAQYLHEYESLATKDSSRGKKTTDRKVEDILESKNLRALISGLTELLTGQHASPALFKEVKDSVITLPPDLFPLFITLLRFEYYYLKSSTN